MIYFEFILRSGSFFFSFVLKKFCKQKKKSYQNFKKNQNILTLSVWHFLTFVTIKIVDEPKQQILILATNEVIESRCAKSCDSLKGTVWISKWKKKSLEKSFLSGPGLYFQSSTEDIAASRLLHDFTHRDSITLLVAKMRICCFGFIVTNVRKCQTEWFGIFGIYFAFW